MHTHPTEGEAQYVAKPVIDMLFPPGTPSRIPIVAVTGSNGKTTTARMIAHIFKGMGRKVGMTSTDGILVDGRLIRRGDMSGPKSASTVLQNPNVEMAVFEVARGGILREGLGYDRNDVAVVLNVTGDHLGLGGINSIRQLAAVKQVLVEAVPRDGTAVLNADDPLVAAMASHCSGSVIYFSMDPGNETIRRQASRGRRAVTIEPGRNGEMIVLRHGRKSLPLVWTHLLPATFEGRARMNVQNALAAAGAAWAAGAHLHDIRQGLRTFTTSYFMAPGRLNMFELDGYRVIVDYAHNPPAVAALGEFVDRLGEPSPGGRRALVSGQRIGVMATAGDRRDEDIVELGRIAADHFDTIIMREDANTRGRHRGETAALIERGVRAGMASGGRCTSVETVLDEMEATRYALDMGHEGDVIVVCVDHANDVWKELQHRQHGGATVTASPDDGGRDGGDRGRRLGADHRSQPLELDRAESLRAEPLEDLGPLDVAHHRHHVTPAGTGQERLERGQLVRQGRHLPRVSALRQAGAQDRVHLPEVTAAQVVALLADHHVIGVGQRARRGCGGSRRSGRRRCRPPGAPAPGPCHGRGAPAPRQASDRPPSAPPGRPRCARSRRGPAPHRARRGSAGPGCRRCRARSCAAPRRSGRADPQGVRGGGGRQRVGDVVLRQPGEGDRQVDDAGEPPRRAAGGQQHQPAALEDRGATAAIERGLDLRRGRVEAERVPASTGLPPHRPYQRIGGIQHGPARALRDAHHRRLRRRPARRGCRSPAGPGGRR